MLEGLDCDKAGLLFSPTCRKKVLLTGSEASARKLGGFFLVKAA